MVLDVLLALLLLDALEAVEVKVVVIDPLMEVEVTAEVEEAEAELVRPPVIWNGTL